MADVGGVNGLVQSVVEGEWDGKCTGVIKIHCRCCVVSPV